MVYTAIASQRDVILQQVSEHALPQNPPDLLCSAHSTSYIYSKVPKTLHKNLHIKKWTQICMKVLSFLSIDNNNLQFSSLGQLGLKQAKNLRGMTQA